jgi:tetratricopeptide (TPR) repeat protein
MLRTRIILIVVSAALVWLIFLLPKVVVENDSQLATAPDSLQQSPPAGAHAAMPAALAKAIASLRAQYVQAPGKEKYSIFADSLRNLYSQAGQFDSAAWFAEQSATFLQTIEAAQKTGDSYYEAYTFAMDADKQKRLAEKTREWLGKVIEANPRALDAKTKIAMTYLSSPSPMQGIMMLREVLEEDPKNEFAIFNMGMLSLQSGQHAKAAERFKELVTINPRHTQGQLLLGVAYVNLGDKANARQQFEKVKKMDNDPSVQATADSYLNDLN